MIDSCLRLSLPVEPFLPLESINRSIDRWLGVDVVIVVVVVVIVVAVVVAAGVFAGQARSVELVESDWDFSALITKQLGRWSFAGGRDKYW